MALIQRNPIRDPKTIQALESIRRKNHGLLEPEQVVRAARPKRSPLHDYFTWDDNAAAAHWRMHQARNLIRVVVLVDEPAGGDVRAYVSLNDDRRGEGDRGYRHIVDVMSDAERRAQLLGEALDELHRLEAKYARLKELAPVFAAARRVKREAEVAAARGRLGAASLGESWRGKAGKR